MNEQSAYKLADSKRLFSSRLQIGADDRELCRVSGRPYLYYFVMVAICLIMIALLPDKWYFFVIAIAAFSLVVFLNRNQTALAVYDNFVVFYYYGSDGHKEYLQIPNDKFVSWEVKPANNNCEIVFLDKQDNTQVMIYPSTNLHGVTSALQKYYRDKSGPNMRVTSFKQRIRSRDGQSMFEKIISRKRDLHD